MVFFRWEKWDLQIQVILSLSYSFTIYVQSFPTPDKMRVSKALQQIAVASLTFAHWCSNLNGFFSLFSILVVVCFLKNEKLLKHSGGDCLLFLIVTKILVMTKRNTIAGFYSPSTSTTFRWSEISEINSSGLASLTKTPITKSYTLSWEMCRKKVGKCLKSQQVTGMLFTQ